MGLAVGIAILRYQLLDIDVIIRRTLIYGLLTAIVVGVYVLVVGTLIAVFQNSGNLLISLIATGIVAVAFQPLRARLQHIVGKYIYCDAHNPYSFFFLLQQRLK